MRKIFLFSISLLIGIGLFFWTLKIVGWQEIKSSFLVFTGWKGLAVLGLTLLMMLVGVWKWKEILKGVGVNVSFKGLINPYLAGFSIMFLVPIFLWGGEIFRSYILRERNSAPWPKGMASVIIDRILEWTANLVVIFLGGLFFVSTIGLPSAGLGIIFGGIFLVFLIGIVFFYFKCIKKESIVGFFLRGNQGEPLETEKEIFKFFKPNKPQMWKAVSLAFLRAGIMYFRAWLLILFLGKSIGALPVLSILGFSYLSLMIPIPTALGTHEALQTFAFGSLNLSISTATAFTMIIRGAELIVALIGIVFLFRSSVILLKRAFFKKVEKLSKQKE
ncbi:MAG: lysylphosphatidylglycerol synthase transmembrane domain-containing protein [bacterium]